MSQNKDKVTVSDINSLPNKVLVNISRGKKGAWIADLPKYDIFTEADSEIELDFFINDLIFSYFDVPEAVRHMVKYSPSFKDLKAETQSKDPSWEEIAFLKFFSPEASSFLNE